MLNQKNVYEVPQMQIALLNDEDILTLSNGGAGDGTSISFGSLFGTDPADLDA